MEAEQKISVFGQFAHWFKTFSLPGFEGFPVYVILNDILQNFRDFRMFERAAAISFNILLAVPPTLIFLASLVPFLPLQNVEAAILNAVHLLSPNEAFYKSISDTIIDFLHTKRRDLLSIGILFTVFYSSNGLMGVMRAFDRVSEAMRFRTGVQRRLKAIKLTIILMLLSIVLVTFLIFQSRMMNYILQPYPDIIMLVRVSSHISMILIIFSMMCILYKYSPSLYEKIKFFSPGAIFSTFFILVESYIFFYIATHIISYDKIYGSLGTLFMVLAWLSITSVILLIGFEINISILIRKKKMRPRNYIRSISETV